MLFKNIHKEYSRKIEHAKKIAESTGKSFETKELLISYEILLREYRKSIEMKWHLVVPDIYDAFSVSGERDNLHNLVEKMQLQKIDFDASTLEELDHQWQDWLMVCISNGEVSTDFYKKETEPRSKWWLYFEIMDKLSEIEKGTL